jgi:hypothetical protein
MTTDRTEWDFIKPGHILWADLMHFQLGILNDGAESVRIADHILDCPQC